MRSCHSLPEESLSAYHLLGQRLQAFMGSGALEMLGEFNRTRVMGCFYVSDMGPEGLSTADRRIGEGVDLPRIG